MTDSPITPPPNLVSKWAGEFYGTTIAPGEAAMHIAHQAARWGADQELEACCEWFASDVVSEVIDVVSDLRAARRPPPSLKEQALEALKHAPGPDYPNPITLLTADEHALIRRALEALDD
jgi:hypothetical protein